MIAKSLSHSIAHTLSKSCLLTFSVVFALALLFIAEEYVGIVATLLGAMTLIIGSLIWIAQQLIQAWQARQALRKSEERLAKVFRASPDAIVVATMAEGRFLEVNDSFLRLSGYSREEVIGRTALELNIWSNLADRGKLRTLLQTEGRVCNLKVDCCPKSGEVRSVILSAEIIEGEEPPCFLTVARDVTEQERQQQSLQRSEANLSAAQRVSHVGSWELDVETQAFTGSDEQFQIYGFDPALPEPTYAELRQSIYAADRAMWHETVKQVMTQGIPYEMDVRILRPDGSMRYVECRAEAVFGEPGPDGTRPVVKVLGTTLDITERKQLEQLLRSQSQVEQALNQVVQAIRHSLDLSTIFSTTAAEVSTLLDVDRVNIVQYLPEEQGWLCVAEYCQVADIPSRLGGTIPDRDNDIAAQLKRFQVVQVDNCTHGHHVISDAAIAFPGASLLIPLQINTRCWGSLTLLKRQRPYNWQASEIQLGRRVADQLSIAIQQSELYQQVQHLNTSLETQVQERTWQLQRSLSFEALLKRITDKVRDSIDESQILQAVVQELAVGLEVDCCDVALYDLEQRTGTICYEYTYSTITPIKGSVARLDEIPDILVQMMQGQHVQFCPVTQPANFRRIIQNYAVLSCPLINETGVFGDIWLYRPHQFCFSDLEIRLVEQVANQCSIALRQSQLYQAAQKQVEALERLNYLKDDFLSTISHELRTPISNIKMATQLLEEALLRQEDRTKLEATFEGNDSSQPRSLNQLTSSSEKVGQYLQILKDECRQEINLINDLLDITRLEAETEPLSVVTVEMRNWILQILESFEERSQAQQQELQIDIPDTLPALTTDLLSLQRVLMELLDNACKYTPAGETIRVQVQVTQNSDTQFKEMVYDLVVYVTSTGVQIPEAERDRIFDKFYRIPNDDPWKYRGTGLGLALVKKLVKRLAGTIQVEIADRQITFILQVPLQPMCFIDL